MQDNVDAAQQLVVDMDDAPPYSVNVAEASKEVQHRVRALKKLQVENINVEAEFRHRVFDLEKEFQSRFNAIHEKRKAIVIGEHQPTEEECNLPLVHGLSQAELEKLESNAPSEETPSKGIPNFWLYTLVNCPEVSDYIYPGDIPILKHLVDITTEILSNGFMLRFHFEPNEFFVNNVLVKTYELRFTPDAEAPFEYDGPEIIACKGDHIDWKEGQNVTKQANGKKRNADGRVILSKTDSPLSPSFFTFFDAQLQKFDEGMTDDDHAKFMEHAEMGQTIREKVIHRAVLFYTGEIDDDLYDDTFDDEDYDEEDDEEDSDDEVANGAGAKMES